MWLLLFGLCGGHFFSRSVYRFYFHPIRRFPGPKLAAITSCYEFYYDVVRNGRYLFEIGQMHEKYGRLTEKVSRSVKLKVSTGPVVRISPGELHIKDSCFYDEIYAPTSKRREKDSRFATISRFPNSMIATVNHDLHRFRRGLLNTYFSKNLY